MPQSTLWISNFLGHTEHTCIFDTTHKNEHATTAGKPFSSRLHLSYAHFTSLKHLSLATQGASRHKHLNMITVAWFIQNSDATSLSWRVLEAPHPPAPMQARDHVQHVKNQLGCTNGPYQVLKDVLVNVLARLSKDQGQTQRSLWTRKCSAGAEALLLATVPVSIQSRRQGVGRLRGGAWTAYSHGPKMLGHTSSRSQLPAQTNCTKHRQALHCCVCRMRRGGYSPS